MPANELLTERLRESLINIPKVEEKKMFNGITFMIDDKMCICVSNDELLCRIDPDVFDQAMEKNGVRPMVHSGRSMKGYLYVSEEGYSRKKDFDYWVNLCLDFNKRAKSSKKKSSPKKVKK
jgi:TfoX/Sxy family transcriptional regulator of competence genes